MKPKLLSTLPGYPLGQFGADAVAGMTVAMVALTVLSYLTVAIGVGVGLGLALRFAERRFGPQAWSQPDR